MTQEDKDLLLKDLCARLPYGIVINTGDKDLKLDRHHQCIGVLYPEDCSDEFNERNNNASFYITISGCYYGEEIKPYLRPMSSMTEEERYEIQGILGKDIEIFDDFINIIDSSRKRFSFLELQAVFDWFNKKMFDYRGLIEKGLALEAPEVMYKID